MGAAISALPAMGKGDKTMADQEFKAAEQTYSGFLGLLKVGVIATAIVTLLVVLLIS